MYSLSFQNSISRIVSAKPKTLRLDVASYETPVWSKVLEMTARAMPAMVEAYWNVGREIVEKQGGAGRAAYGDGLIDSLAAKLTVEFGPGYTRFNLRSMRRFYTLFPIRHTVCGKLTWSHYRTLITVEDDAPRSCGHWPNLMKKVKMSAMTAKNFERASQ